MAWSDLPGRTKAAVAFVSTCFVVVATVLGIIAATGSFVGDGSTDSRPFPDLFFKEFKASPPGGKPATDTRKDITAIVIHGATSNSDTLAGLSKMLAEQGANATGLNWHVAAVTLRHHGNNRLGAKLDQDSYKDPAKYPWAGRPDMDSAAADVAHLLETRLGWKVPDIIVAHSMGCKVTTSLIHQLRTRYGALGVAAPGGRDMQAWLLDGRTGHVDLQNTPGLKEPGSAATFTFNLQKVSLPIPSPDFLKQWLTATFNAKFTADWGDYLVSLLIPSELGSGYEFTFDVNGLPSMVADYFDKDTSDWILPKSNGPSYFIVRAMDDVYWNNGEAEALSIIRKGHKVYNATGENHGFPIMKPQLVLDMMLPEMKGIYDK